MNKEKGNFCYRGCPWCSDIELSGIYEGVNLDGFVLSVCSLTGEMDPGIDFIFNPKTNIGKITEVPCDLIDALKRRDYHIQREGRVP